MIGPLCGELADASFEKDVPERERGGTYMEEGCERGG